MNFFMMGIDSEGMLISAVPEEDGHEGLNLLMVVDCRDIFFSTKKAPLGSQLLQNRRDI